MPHLVEIWEMAAAAGRTVHLPACLSCGWFGGKGSRPEAEREAEMHERGEPTDRRRRDDRPRPGPPRNPARKA